MANCAYCSKRAVKYYVRSIKAMGQTAESVLKWLKKEMMVFLTICREVDTHHNFVCNNSNMCCESQEHMVNMIESLLSTVPEEQNELRNHVQQETKTILDMIETKRRSVAELAKNKGCLEKLQNLITDVLEKGTLSEILLTFSSVSKYDLFVAEVGTYTKNIEDIYNKFRRDKHHRRLSYADEQNHMFDRKKIVEVCQKLSSKVEQCVKERAEFHGKFQAWLSEVKGRHDEAEKYQQRLITMMEADKVHQQTIKTLQVQCQQRCNAVMEKILQVIQFPPPHSVSSSVATDTPSQAVVNGFHDDKPNSGLLKKLEKKITALSHVTKDSTRTAKENSQHLENLTTSLIEFCSIVNEDVSLSFEQLQEEALAGSDD